MQKVLIVGGGIAGLAAGIALSRRGIHAEIVELSPDATVHHVGLVVQGNFLRALSALGIAEQATRAGQACKGLQLRDADGILQAEIPAVSPAGTGLPGELGLGRAALHQVMMGAARSLRIVLRPGVTFTTLAQERTAVRVDFTDGTTSRYDLVIGADGVYSKVRSLLFGEAGEPRFTGQGVWRAIVPRPPGEDWTCLYLGRPGGTAGHVPLTADTLQVFLSSAEPGNPRFPRDTLAPEFRRRLQGYGGMLAALREQISDSARVAYRPLETLLMPAPWYRGRVLLIGDAAHAATPHLGHGAAMAVEDAVVLAEELERAIPIEQALEAFMRRRHLRARALGEASMQLGQWELSPSGDADPVGLRRRSLALAAEPI